MTSHEVTTIVPDALTPAEILTIRLFAHLKARRSTLSQFACERGTTPARIKGIIEAFAGSDRYPKKPESQELLQACVTLAEQPLPWEAPSDQPKCICTDMIRQERPS